MADISDTEIREFISIGGGLPKMDDLPSLWDRGDGSLRGVYLHFYLAISCSKRWAWDGLDRLLRELQKRPEPVPVELMQWGSEAYTGLRKPPGKARGWGDKTDERRRTGRVFWLLRDQGLTREKAFGRIADSLDVSDETIRSRIRKEIWEFPSGR